MMIPGLIIVLIGTGLVSVLGSLGLSITNEEAKRKENNIMTGLLLIFCGVILLLIHLTSSN